MQRVASLRPERCVGAMPDLDSAEGFTNDLSTLEARGRNDRTVEVRTRHADHRWVHRRTGLPSRLRRRSSSLPVRCGEDRRSRIQTPERASGIAVVPCVAVVVDSAVRREDPIATTVRCSDSRGHRGSRVSWGTVIGQRRQTCRRSQSELRASTRYHWRRALLLRLHPSSLQYLGTTLRNGRHRMRTRHHRKPP